MKLIDKLEKTSNKAINELYESIYDQSPKDKEDKIKLIYQYYTDYRNYIYLFTDAEVAFLESEIPYKERKKLFKAEINSLKERLFICYNSTTKQYELFEDLIEPYYQYRTSYSIEDREKYGLYRFLMIAYANAYGAIREDELEQLLKDIFEDYDLDVVLDLLRKSNNYQHQIMVKKYEGDYYFCIHDDFFSKIAIDLKQEAYIDDFALLDEETLLAYYYDGYDSTNPSLYELEGLLGLTKGEKKTFVEYVIFTFALLQPKNEILGYILEKIRFRYYTTNAMIIRAFGLVEETYRTYGSWLTKGYSPEKVEKIIEENFELMKEEMEEENDPYPVNDRSEDEIVN